MKLRIPGARGAAAAQAAAGPRWTRGGADLAPRAATVVLAAAVAAQLALLAWRFVPAPPAPPPPATAAARPAFDPSAILAAQLFGAAAPVQVAGAEAPRTQVPLVLAGTIAAGDPTKGLAIVGENAQAARVYAVGAQLPGGVRLHEVYPDRVVLDRGGALETLPLPRQLGAGFGAPPAASAGAVAPAPAGQGIGEAVQRMIAQGPEIVGELVRPMPEYAGGQLKGFRLFPGQDRQKFAQLGLQPGDLVTQVNGVPLSDPQRGMEILRTLGNAGSATVTVERNGTAQQLTVNASQVASFGSPAAVEAVPPARELVQPSREAAED